MDSQFANRQRTTLCVFVSGATAKNGELFTLEQELRAASVVARYAGRRDENIQVNGYTFVFDFSGFGTKHMTNFTMDDMRNWHKCWQVQCAYIYLTK